LRYSSSGKFRFQILLVQRLQAGNPVLKSFDQRDGLKHILLGPVFPHFNLPDGYAIS
jgi:hypothetical protein